MSLHPLGGLPHPRELSRTAIAIAALDAVICPEWEYRYYSFDPQWAPGQWMASMRNGSGDHWFLVGIAGTGLALKGLSHESPAFRHNDPMPGILDDLPNALAADFTNEPAFDMHNVSFVAWRLDADTAWQIGTTDKEDGAAWLLEVLMGPPSAYQAFAEEYYEQDVPLQAVEHVFQNRPMTPDVARMLNPNLAWPDCVQLLTECGYPLADS